MNSVLIVEDEKHLADGLRYNLKAEGYDVETAGTGEEALALLIDDRKTLRRGRARRDVAGDGWVFTCVASCARRDSSFRS